jgi:hypothetical protein
VNATEKGKQKYKDFHQDRFINKTTPLRDTIHRGNTKNMLSIRNKPKKTTKKVIRAMNMTEKSIEVARDRGIGTDVLLGYDVVPSPLLFNDDGLMTKPEKSQLVRDLEETLKPEEYCYRHKDASAFLIDVMAAIRRVPVSGLSNFSDLLSKFAELNDVYHHYGRCDYIFDIYNDNPSVKDTERLRRCSATPVVLSSVELTTPLPKDMTTFWPSSKNKVLLEILIYEYVRVKSSESHEKPTILSQLCMDSNEWRCIKIHDGTEHDMRQLQSQVEEADLRIPMHVLDCLQAGHKTCVVISNDTDVIVALLFHLPTFLQNGLQELWIRAGRGNTTRYVPLHILHARLGPLMCTVLPAVHNLTGCDITSKIGTKKAALKADPVAYLQGFGATAPLTPSVIQYAEQYLVHVVDAGSNSSNFLELRAHQFHFSKSTSHQNLPPTTQGLEPHVYRAFFNAYTTMHCLDRQLNIETAELDPLDYGFALENGSLLASTAWKSLEPRWSVVCCCGKCACVTCPCRAALVKCSVFCKCQKTDNDCRNPHN